MNEEAIVIIGGGHAAAQLCAGLIDAGAGPRTTLICAEATLPYQRPPLSKSFLKNAAEIAQLHRTPAWYAEGGVTVQLGQPAVAVDRQQKLVSLGDGQQIPYHRLVLATGGRARLLTDLPPGLANVATLRSAADAEALRTQMVAFESLTVVGGGFIGLEFAATARHLGKRVTVVESAPRLLARAVSPEISEHVLQLHRASGIEIHLNAKVAGFEIAGQMSDATRRLVAIELDGARHPVDLVLLGIGALPETGLAEAAGIACENGIVVDEYMVTSDPAILAVGDCTNFPDIASGRRLRLESVQNANDQARTAVATLLGAPRAHNAVPWFWSEQGNLRLQMAGLPPAHAERYKRMSPPPGRPKEGLLPLGGTARSDQGASVTAKADSFSIFHYADGVLHCVESVNAPLDHMMARKLLETGKSPAPAVACDPAVALKTLL